MAAAGVLEAKLDENLTRFGFKKGSTTFVFNADHTFEANLNGMPISGTYTLDPSKKVLTLSLLGGLMKFHPQVVRPASGISILFDNDKLLSLLGAASKIAGTVADSRFSYVSSLLSNYQGLKLGLKLRK